MTTTNWITIGLFVLMHGAAVVYAAGRITARLDAFETRMIDGKEKMDGQQTQLDNHEHRLTRLETAHEINHGLIAREVKG